MKEKTIISEYQELGMKICEILDDNKAMDINLIDIQKSSNVADYFVVATGTSRVQVKALMDEVEHALEADGIFVLRRDGVGDGRWVVLDYGLVVVHLFTSDVREYYHVEKLWVDGKNTMNMQAINKLKEKIQKEQSQEQEKQPEKKETESAKVEKAAKKTKKEKTENAKETKKPAKTTKKATKKQESE